MSAIDQVGLAVARRFPQRPPGTVGATPGPAAALVRRPEGVLHRDPNALVDPFHNAIDLRSILVGLLRLLSPAWEFLRARPRQVAIAVLVLAGFVLSALVGFGGVYFCVVAIIGIFNNLGERKEGELSAYSIFNRGNERLPGTFTAEDIDAQFRSGAGVLAPAARRAAAAADAGPTQAQHVAATLALMSRLRVGKDGNKPCPCGSGRKFKKCCYDSVAAMREADRGAAVAERTGRAPPAARRGTGAADGEDEEDWGIDGDDEGE